MKKKILGRMWASFEVSFFVLLAAKKIRLVLLLIPNIAYSIFHSFHFLLIPNLACSNSCSFQILLISFPLIPVSAYFRSCSFQFLLIQHFARSNFCSFKYCLFPLLLVSNHSFFLLIPNLPFNFLLLVSNLALYFSADSKYSHCITWKWTEIGILIDHLPTLPSSIG